MLDEQGIDSLEYAQQAQKLYDSAGKPQYEGDLAGNEKILQWREFMRTGMDLTITVLSLRKIKRENLSLREEELTKRLQANTEARIIMSASRDKYPPELTKLAKKTNDLGKKASYENTQGRQEYLEAKLELETAYLRFLVDNI